MHLKVGILILFAMGIVHSLFAQTADTPTKSSIENEKLKKQIEQLRMESWQLRTQAEMRENELNQVKKQKIINHEQELLQQAPENEQPAAVAKQVPPKSPWSNEVEIGGALSRGNRSSSQGMIAASTLRVTEKDQLQARAYGEIAREDGDTKAQVARGTAEYRHDITTLYYWLLAASMEHDRIVKVDYRGAVGPGIGQHIVKMQNFELMAEAGPSYFFERKEHHNADYSVRMRLAQELWWRIIKPVRFFERAELLNDFDYGANRLLNVEAGFESSITDHLCLRLTVRERFEGMPADDDVKKNDLSFITSVVWGF